MEIYQPCTSNMSLDANNRFHVFLSFRGPDVRNTFVGHLYEALSVAGLQVFLDSEELEKGKGIEYTLQTTIETSDILIPIFSRGYAESTWCLEEAAQMCRSNGRKIPLFYDVQPSDVRQPQRKGGLFSQAFQKHYTHLDRHHENTIEEWKRALHQISGFSGWSLQAESGHEGRLVKKVVKDVLDILNKMVPLDVPTHLVGLNRSISELINSLHVSSTDIELVRVGISGIGGVGKTAFAKAVYNEIYRRFDARCFLFNIGASAQNNTILMDLQRRILRGLVKYEGEVLSVDEGRALMRDRLRGVRALVILDDVNEKEQLHALYGDWFRYGSRIIITSRDQHILNLAKVDSVFEMRGLGEDEALELFSWHAFCRALPETPYQELSTKIARACRGHPLSLEVIAAQLFDKKEPNDIQCWEAAAHDIGENPGVSRILQTSYDGLSHVEKQLFLDIACYFVGETKQKVEVFWEVLYPNRVQTAIKNLLLKMLINMTGPQNVLHMHDILREMGRGIQKQSVNNSRLWLPMGAQRAFNRDKAEVVNMLVYTGENVRYPVALYSMPSLRYLFLQNTRVCLNIGELAPNLIWIEFKNCEITIDTHTWMIPRNKIQSEGSWSQVKILCLQECASLTKIPNTLNSWVNLQYLYILHCQALTTLPSTVGNLSQLKQLTLRGCDSLASLPDTLGNLLRLKYLCLNECGKLKYLPSTLGNLAQLEVLDLTRCKGLRLLPNTIGCLAQLEVLNLHCCSGLQIFPYMVSKLIKLRILNFHPCASLGSFHHIVAKLAKLRELHRSAGLGSLVQKKFNVYLGFCVENEGEKLMDHLQKPVRIGRGRVDNPSLCTVSLRICRGREDDQDRDNSWAIDSSDILVPVFSKGFTNSDSCIRHLNAMYRSDGLIIPLYHHVHSLPINVYRCCWSRVFAAGACAHSHVHLNKSCRAAKLLPKMAEVLCLNA